jgi:hypothetical protein
MNLFWKNLFGAITPTSKLEKDEKELIEAMHRYDEVENSVELVEYKNLFHVVKSSSYIENKKTLQNRKYKDTEEFRIFRKYGKLQNSTAIKLYFQVLNSVELEQYLAFKATPEFEELGDKTKVKQSEKLLRFKKFEHSKEFKTYSRFHNSFIITEFEQLKIKTSTPEFKKSNDFWSNPRRWQTTSEYATEQRFYELANNKDIIFFTKEKPERFENYRRLKLTFQEDFDWNTLDKSSWKFGFHYKSQGLMGNHSFANEQQANNSGRNVSVEDSILKINTKHEIIKAAAWHPTKGFIEKEFQYTSDVLQLAEKFRQNKGEFKAKIRTHGNINHAFWLGADHKLPQINIFHFDGKCIRVGNANRNLLDGIKIKGLNPRQFYIYSLRWTAKEMVWSINDLEVYRTSSNIPNEAMYIVFNSFITQNQHPTTGLMEVDWVKTYQY